MRKPTREAPGRAGTKGISSRRTPLIGFIGQGFIGKNYADDFENRGFSVTRYARGEPYRGNKEKIKECDIVFIAVPTPTTPTGFDFSVVREALTLVGRGKTAVIKSTILPGTTKALEKEFPSIFLMHSPEFLREATAAYDAAHPERNIVGISKNTVEYRKRAHAVMKILPRAPFERVLGAREAELVKYGGNCFLYTKVIFMNLLYDLSRAVGAEWGAVRDAVAADLRIGASHSEPVHRSGHGGQSGRGAGGHCFIKDFAAFSRLYAKRVSDKKGIAVLMALEDKNNELLAQSGKDLDLLEEVFGRKARSTKHEARNKSRA